MTTSVYVARLLGVDTGSMTGDGSTVGTIVGGDTALDTNDGDTSYVMVHRNGDLYVPDPLQRTEITFRWERLSGPVPTVATTSAVTIEGVLRRDDTSTPAQGFSVTFSAPGTSGLSFAWGYGGGTSDDWQSRSQVSYPSLVDGYTDGTVWVISPLVPSPGNRNATRITYLRAVIESAGGTPPLRQRNRDTIRARNRASRQRGIRQRGYL